MGKQFGFVRGVVYRTVDGGENWAVIWRGDNLGRYIWSDPRNSNVIYVSTGIFDREARNSDPARDFPGGVGIIKSIDGGRTWQVLNAANGLQSLYVGSLFMHPQNPDILLAGAGTYPYSKGSGAYLSTDAGRGWVRTTGVVPTGEPAMGHAMTSVEFALSDPRIAYVASENGFWRSEDGGRTWKAMSGGRSMDTYGPPGTPMGKPIDLQVDPRNPDRVFINNYSGGNFLTEDGGHTWTVASKGYTGAQVWRMAVDPRDAQRIYAIGISGVFRSDDGGERWEGLHYFLPQENPTWNALALDPGNPNRVLLSEHLFGRLYRSNDGGKNWEQVYRHSADCTGVHTCNGFRALAFAPSNPRILYAGMRRQLFSVDWGYLGHS